MPKVVVLPPRFTRLHHHFVASCDVVAKKDFFGELGCLLEPSWEELLTGKGYVGVGEVTATALKVDKFMVDQDGAGVVPLHKLPVTGPNIFKVKYGQLLACRNFFQ